MGLGYCEQIASAQCSEFLYLSSHHGRAVSPENVSKATDCLLAELFLEVAGNVPCLGFITGFLDMLIFSKYK